MMIAATLAILPTALAPAEPLFFAPDALVGIDPHHATHYKLLHDNLPRYNPFVLMAVDLVQQHAVDGGGYFVGVKADPPESPVGYPLSLFDTQLLVPARPTSYCSGSSYTVLIEALNFIFGKPLHPLTAERIEAMRMQEPDGARREDKVKAWGWWNADGFGTHFSMVQFLGIGDRISPSEARPGDFMNISWKSGLGHSVVFLGWCVNKDGEASIDYWSSQTGTNGFGDQISPLNKVKEICAVRLTKPQNLFTFDPAIPVDTTITGDPPPLFGSR